MSSIYKTQIKHVTTEDYLKLLRIGLEEDRVDFDITTDSIIGKNETCIGEILAKENGILCGMGIWDALKLLYPNFQFNCLKNDGDSFIIGEKIIQINGLTHELLKIERVVLNFLQFLSGIATNAYHINKIKKSNSFIILDTRKTIPGYRKLSKYAVFCGGGTNHRLDLEDMAMIKDNHLILTKFSIPESIQIIRKNFPNKSVEIEVDTIEQLKIAINSSPDVILLDNFSFEETIVAIKIIEDSNKNIFIEYSGGLTEEKIKQLSEINTNLQTGASLGKITHSVKFIDFSMEIH